MPRSELVEFQRRDEDGEWEEWMTLLSVQQNKTRSREFVQADQEQSAARVTFRFRWNPELSRVEFDMDCVRMLWRGQYWDIQGYDDFKFQHRIVNVEAVSYGQQGTGDLRH